MSTSTTGAGRPGEHPVAALTTSGLARQYGAFIALDEVDLSVRAGECVLLLGPNGAGKSTLLRICATILRPTSGSLRIYGEEPRGEGRTSLRRRIGYLSHQTFLYDHLTAAENLVYYARLYDLPDPSGTARAALAAAGLLDRESDQVHTFSRGMQQRLAIARALLHRPDLLLLDEPFTGLDRDSCGRLQHQIRESRSQSRACVLATHDFAAGLTVADRVLILAAGRIVADFPVEGIEPRGLDELFRGVICDTDGETRI